LWPLPLLQPVSARTRAYRSMASAPAMSSTSRTRWSFHVPPASAWLALHSANARAGENGVASSQFANVPCMDYNTIHFNLHISYRMPTSHRPAPWGCDWLVVNLPIGGHLLLQCRLPFGRAGGKFVNFAKYLIQTSLSFLKKGPTNLSCRRRLGWPGSTL